VGYAFEMYFDIAFELALESGVFGRARLSSIGIVKFRPVTQLASYLLRGETPGV